MTPSFLTDETKAAIVADAELFTHEEVCGLILQDGSIIPVDNMIEGSGIEQEGELLDRTTGILIDEGLIIEYEDELAAIYHSHHSDTQDGYLSFTDIAQSRFHQIPYLLYHTTFKTWDYFDPNYYHPAPLLENGNPKKLDYYKGWNFVYGRSDCSMLLRSYFHYMKGIDIPDYPRPADGEWYKNPIHQTAYQDLMEDPINGFRRVNTSTPKKHDVILVRWFGSRYASHAGIMVEDDKVLHIIENRQSEVVPLGGEWTRRLHSIWRLA